jgi:hypothetical protein
MERRFGKKIVIKKPMTIYQFNLLEEDQKYQTVWDLGKHIDTVIDEEKRVLLYAIDMFFVEVHYDANTNKIIDIKSFIHGHNLDKYAGSILP